MPRILNKNNLIAVLDIGTSKTCCLLAYDAGEKGALIVGAGEYQNTGLKKSEIIDLESSAQSVRKAVATAETYINERITTVITNTCVSTLTSEIIQDNIELMGKEVTQSEINRLISATQNKIPETQEEILHCIPIDYSLDTRHSISDPRGLTGNKLYLSLHTISAPAFPIQDMENVLEKSHLSCSKKVVSSYAAGLASLTKEEKKQGTAVIDLGAGTTGISVFYEEQLVFTDKIPLGGFTITKALSRQFNTSEEKAEKIKILKGSCLPSLTYDREEIEIPLIGEDERISTILVSKSDIVALIENHINDLFTKIKTRLKEKGFYDICLNFVLTGGASQLHGINDKATEILGKNVRTGRPLHLFDKKHILPSHTYQSYMNCLGLLYYTTEILLKTPIHQQDTPAPKNKFIRFFRWFLDNS